MSVSLTWLGHAGFAVNASGMTFYVDPMNAENTQDADLILCTHRGPTHMHPPTLKAMLEASPHARVVLPKSVADYANSLGIPNERLTTTDSDLRIEYFKNGLYGRVYAVPSAHPELHYTPIGGYPQLGYLIRFGDITIYHAGDCRMYDGIVDRLRPYRVTVAILPIEGEGNFTIVEAAQLAEDIGVKWLVPMHYQSADRFVDHMLGFRPATGFKVFQPGEYWTVPE
jgi:L-ascorbate 6-phosphate lactonase